MKIAGIMCTLDEEIMAPLAIESIKNFVDELIVIDGGSNDHTVEFIESITDMYKIPLKLEVRADLRLRDARLHAIKLTDADWVLIIDGDEVYHTDRENNIEQLREIMELQGACVFRAPMNNLYLDFWTSRTTQAQGAGHKFLYRNDGNIKPAGLRDLPDYDGRQVYLDKVFKFNCSIKTHRRMFMRRWWYRWSKKYSGSLSFVDYVLDWKGWSLEELDARAHKWHKERYTKNDIERYDPDRYGYLPAVIRWFVEEGGQPPQ